MARQALLLIFVALTLYKGDWGNGMARNKRASVEYVGE
jgi:hypothetical protein